MHDPLLSGIQGIHRALTRAIDVIVEESARCGAMSKVSGEETEGFRLFARAYCDLLHAHHDGEEEIAFPTLADGEADSAARANMSRQHQEMLPAHHVIQGVVATPAPWDRSTWLSVHRATMSLVPGWRLHRDEEERWFAQASARKTAKERAALARRLAEHGLAHSGPMSLIVPFILYNLRGEERASMARVFPFFVRGLLAPYVWRGTWKPMARLLYPA